MVVIVREQVAEMLQKLQLLQKRLWHLWRMGAYADVKMRRKPLSPTLPP